MVTITPKELLSQDTFSAAKFFLAYKECSPTIQAIVDEMMEIVDDSSIDWDEREHAADVIIEALFPALTSDCQSFAEAMQSTTDVQEIEAALDEEEAGFAERLARLMNQKGMTQTQLAELTKVSQPAISNILNRNCRPQRGTVVRFAKALGVSPEELWPTT